MKEWIIPPQSWTQHLAVAVCHAAPEDTIVVLNDNQKALAERALARQGRPTIRIEVRSVTTEEGATSCAD